MGCNPCCEPWKVYFKDGVGGGLGAEGQIGQMCRSSVRAANDWGNPAQWRRRAGGVFQSLYGYDGFGWCHDRLNDDLFYASSSSLEDPDKVRRLSAKMPRAFTVGSVAFTVTSPYNGVVAIGHDPFNQRLFYVADDYDGGTATGIGTCPLMDLRVIGYDGSSDTSLVTWDGLPAVSFGTFHNANKVVYDSTNDDAYYLKHYYDTGTSTNYAEIRRFQLPSTDSLVYQLSSTGFGIAFVCIKDITIDFVNRRLFWSQIDSGAGTVVKVRRSDMDGSSPTDVYDPADGTLDQPAPDIYWSHGDEKLYSWEGAAIYRMDYDGSNQETLTTSGGDPDHWPWGGVGKFSLGDGFEPILTDAIYS